MDSVFSPPELQRYARHFTLPEVGLEGQERLRNGSVLCIGAGGLGSPLALYLAAAGVGRIGIADPDTVDVSNLQRQILHGESDLGRLKIDSARDRLREINPHVSVDTYAERFDAANARDIAVDYDVLVDGTDNFATRYLSNDVAYFLGKPNIYGSIFRFEGQVSVFAPHAGGPCYRCLFPEPPAPGQVPSCAEGGVLGVLPGIIGCLQAAETIKWILGIGDSLAGRLIHLDTLRMQFREFRLRSDPDCPLCGRQPSIRDLADTALHCGVIPPAPAPAEVPERSPPELAAALAKGSVLLLDVREPFERMLSSIPDSMHIPLGDLPARIGEIPKNRCIVVYCRTGIRSASAVRKLLEAGYPDVSQLQGGMIAWNEHAESPLARSR
ncbi:MAG TPA: molybdopterin-synthase adenylyltransferase MoeB [Verrucomicrobiales bacterium]|nr:molybdopterin-synthase adenylyltransferase MoeB [Verrucomicrobiales bacterium]